MTKYFFSFFILFSLCSSCTEIEFGTSTSAEVKNVSIHFVDRSVSSFKGDDVEAKENQAITEAVYASIENDGDEVWVSNIFGQTSNVSNRERWVLKIPELQADGLSRREVKQAQQEHEASKALFKSQFAKKVLASIREIQKDQMQTDIVGCIRHMYDIQKLNREAQISVFVYSDMKHCQNLRTICCDGEKTFSSFEQAKTFGKDDAEVITKYFNYESQPLKGVDKITIHLPSLDLDHDSSMAFIPNYYENLYRELGISQILFN